MPQVRKLSIWLITSQVAKNTVFGRAGFLQIGENLQTRIKGQASLPKTFEGSGLLSPDILFSHGDGLDAEEAKLLQKYAIFISSTPDTEGQMAFGELGCF